MFLKCANWKWNKVKREMILIPPLFRLLRFVVFVPWHFDTSLLSLLNVKFAITGVTCVTRTEVIQTKTEYFISIAQLFCLLAGPLIVCSSTCSPLPHFFMWGRTFLLILTLSVNSNLFLPLTLFPFIVPCVALTIRRVSVKNPIYTLRERSDETWARNEYFLCFGYRHTR